MKIYFSTGQIICIVIICLLVTLVVHIPDLVHGFKDGWNSLH